MLHFLVLMDTPERTVADAQQELRRILNDNEVKLRGPMVFSDGRYVLVSSVLNPSSATPDRELLATGRAPVLEGNRIAFSFDLKPAQATLLMRSFEMPTPDVSIVFDMTFSGLTDAYDADLTVDWTEVRKHQSFNTGGTVYFVSADVELAFDRLRRDNAIKLRSSGTDASMEALLQTVYNKLLELMFRPVEPEKAPDATRGSMLDALDKLLDAKGPMGGTRKFGFGANLAYQLKDLKTTGTSTLNFNHRSTVERHSFVTFNIGDLHRRHGSDPNYFRAVNLGDPTFEQREIHVGIDGAVLPEFDKFINGVTVTLRKLHQNGQETLRELVLDKATIAKAATGFRLVYGWNGDDDRATWLDYDYRTRWSFKGGGAHETPWKRTNAPMINLFVPYERRTIQVVGNRETLQKQQVRAVVVQVEYGFFGERRRHQIVLRPDQNGRGADRRGDAAAGRVPVRLRRHLAARGQPAADEPGTRRDRRTCSWTNFPKGGCNAQAKLLSADPHRAAGRARGRRRARRHQPHHDSARRRHAGVAPGRVDRALDRAQQPVLLPAGQPASLEAARRDAGVPLPEVHHREVGGAGRDQRRPHALPDGVGSHARAGSGPSREAEDTEGGARRRRAARRCGRGRILPDHLRDAVRQGSDDVARHDRQGAACAGQPGGGSLAADGRRRATAGGDVREDAGRSPTSRSRSTTAIKRSPRRRAAS